MGVGNGFTDAISALTNTTGTGGGIGDIFDLASGGASGLSDIGSVAGAASGGSGGSLLGSAFGQLLPLGLSLLGFERGGIVSAAGGALVGSGVTPAILHPKEMVLPADIADKVLKGTGGGDTHVTVNHHVHAIDAKSFEDRLSQHGDAIAKSVHRSLRLSNSHLLRGGR